MKGPLFGRAPRVSGNDVETSLNTIRVEPVIGVIVFLKSEHGLQLFASRFADVSDVGG